jgi:hypothetical protein
MIIERSTVYSQVLRPLSAKLSTPCRSRQLTAINSMARWQSVRSRRRTTFSDLTRSSASCTMCLCVAIVPRPPTSTRSLPVTGNPRFVAYQVDRVHGLCT